MERKVAAEMLEVRLVMDASLIVITHGHQVTGASIPSYAEDPDHWIARIAGETDNAVNREGLGDLNPRYVPVERDDIRDEDHDRLLSHWNGSRDFLVLDWAKYSNDGALADFDQPEHHAAVELAGAGLARMISAWMTSIWAVDPYEMFDVHFIGHSFGTLVNREAIQELASYPQAEWRDYVKVTALDPVGMKPIAEPGQTDPVNQGRDKVRWYHPENQGVDAVANYYQTIAVMPKLVDVLPVEADNDRLYYGRPLDGEDGGGPAAFSNHAIRIWDTTSGHELAVLRGHQDQATSAAYSPDGRWLATGGQDKSVRIFDTATGLEVRTLRTHTGIVTSVAFSPNGQYLVSGGRDSTVGLFRVSDGQQRHVWDEPINDVTNVAFSPDGTLVAATSGTKVRAGRVSDHERQLFLDGPTNDVSAIAFSSDGRYLASGSGQNVRVGNVADGTLRGLLTGPTNDVTSLAFAPNPDVLAVASGHRVWLWSISQWQPLQDFEAATDDLTSVAYRHDGVLATASQNETLKLWDATGTQVGAMKLPNNGLRRIAFHPTNGSLAVVGLDQTNGFVWDENVTDDVKDRVGFWVGLIDQSAFHRAVHDVFVDDVIKATGGNFYRRRDREEVLHFGLDGRVMNEFAEKPWSLPQPDAPDSGTVIPNPGELPPPPPVMLTPANLFGTSFVVSADVVELGSGQVRVDYAVTNSGQTDAGQHRIDFCLSRDRDIFPDDRRLDSVLMPYVGAGQTVYGSRLLILPDASDSIWAGPGTYTLGMIVDAGAQVAESREDDNANRGQLLDRKTITVGPSIADVNLRGEELDVVQEPLEAGRSFDVRFRIRNTLPDRAGPFDVDFYLSRDRYISIADYKLGSFRVAAVDGNSVTQMLATNLPLLPTDHDFYRGNTDVCRRAHLEHGGGNGVLGQRRLPGNQSGSVPQLGPSD